MASFFTNVLKPYQKNKVVLHEYVASEHYTRNVDVIKPRIMESLTSIAHNEITMQFTGTVYVFTENELKELLKQVDKPR